MQVFNYLQILFIVIFLVIFTIAKIQKKNIAYLKQDIFNFTVIPSLAIAASGHLFFGSQIRKGMGWDNSIGTVTLETELGITQLAMFIIACIPRTSPEYIGSLWGLMLVMMGINHFIVKKEFSFVGVLDIIYGGLLIALFSPSLFTKKSRHERNVTDLSTSMTTPCIKDGEVCYSSGDTCCSTNQPCTTRKCPSGSTPPSPPSPISGKVSGYYLLSWLHHPSDPMIMLPSNYNLAITFSGWGASQSNLFGLIPDSYPLAGSQSGHNYISIGGGADTGAWNSNDLDPSLWQNNIIPNSKKRKYTGICFDLERGSATVEQYAVLFKIVKDAGLKVMITVSWFGQATWGFANMPDLTNSFMSDPNVDIFSPQLYTNNCDEVWDGKSNLPSQDVMNKLQSLGSKLVPSINDTGTGTTNNINKIFPNNGGVVQVCNN
jgi:hypothetical protein